MDGRREGLRRKTGQQDRETDEQTRRDGRRLLVTANVVPSSLILVTLMKEALRSSGLRFLQESHGVTSQKTPFFIATAVKTSNPTQKYVGRKEGSMDR
jgi:hypothetical protein